MASTTKSPLRALLDIMASGIDAIEEAYAAQGKTRPGLEDLWIQDELEDKLQPTADQVGAAAFQLLVLMRKPALHVAEFAMTMYAPAALEVVDRANVAEIIRESGSDGLHITAIAEKSGVNPTKLAQILRYLSARAIFQEVSPNVFAHNRHSSILDTGKSVKEAQSSPIGKYNGSNGYMAFVGHTTDEVRKSSMKLADHILEKETSFSEEPHVSPFGSAFNTTQNTFAWLSQPENSFRLQRYGAAMAGTRLLFPANTILQGFDWSSLAEGSVVVDVGGGVGSTTLVLAKAHPKLRYVVEDLPSQLGEAKPYWESNLPSALTSGQVVLQAHNFFEQQPVRGAAVYLLRLIIHDWPAGHAVKILEQLRAVAEPHTRLVVVDFILSSGRGESTELAHIPGVKVKALPSPLEPNFVTGWLPTAATLQMLTFHNAQERILEEFVELGKRSGWSLEQVHRGPPGAHDQLVYTPS